MKKVFTLEDIEQLEKACENGGIFLRITGDKTNPVEVVAGDGNGGWKTIDVLNESISLKIHELYDEDCPMRYRMTSIKGFIDKYR